ncbi:MAG TPA: hypothetical protein VHP61_05420 [Acidobacteriota bacterium]|nr:hypothetical protein [Acidobacteriota bacterium]
MRRMVVEAGVEGALAALFREGVYLAVEEFKGRRPVVRGGTTIEVRAEALYNPLVTPHLRVQTGGSSGRAMPVFHDLGFVAERAVNHRLALEARGDGDWSHAVWGVPGTTDIVRVLELAKMGRPPERWFSLIDLYDPGLHPRYRWSVRLMRGVARAAGVRLPEPEPVPVGRPEVVLEWMRRTLEAGRTPHLIAFVSLAVRLSQAARAAGMSLAGVQFSSGGEPMTAARLAEVRASGATVVPRFIAIECGFIGYGCLAPDGPDDLHVFDDSLAVIRPGGDGPAWGLPPSALLLTSLLPSSSFIMLNVSLGDQAALGPRSCGCPLEALGWGRHLSRIRSYQKLTAGGMSFLDCDLARVLEEDLPRRFGGTPLDYQLAEDEDENGRPKLRLLVSPAVGPLDEAAVVDAFLSCLGRGEGAERVMSLQWREEGFLRIDRRAPLVTAGGKVLHLLRTRA